MRSCIHAKVEVRVKRPVINITLENIQCRLSCNPCVGFETREPEPQLAFHLALAFFVREYALQSRRMVESIRTLGKHIVDCALL